MQFAFLEPAACKQVKTGAVFLAQEFTTLRQKKPVAVVPNYCLAILVQNPFQASYAGL